MTNTTRKFNRLLQATISTPAFQKEKEERERMDKWIKEKLKEMKEEEENQRNFKVFNKRTILNQFKDYIAT